MKVMKVREIEFMDGGKIGAGYIRFPGSNNMLYGFIKVSPSADFPEPVDVYNIATVKRLKGTEWIFTGKSEEEITAETEWI